jgi:DNA-binding transcriptional ArsR family regulator
VFRALADPTRRQILYELRDRELPAGEIASHFPMSGPSVSRHLAVLKSAGLVVERKQANKVIYSLVTERLASSVGPFLSAVCPHIAVRARHRKKKNKPADKASAKRERKPLTSGAGRAASAPRAERRALDTAYVSVTPDDPSKQLRSSARDLDHIAAAGNPSLIGIGRGEHDGPAGWQA